MTTVVAAKPNGALKRSRAAGPAPGLPTRRPARAALGAVIVLACALAGFAVLGSVDHRHAVLVITKAVPPGQTLSADDLGVARVAASGLSMVPASAESSVLGQAALGRLVPGQLLTAGLVGRGPRPDPSLVELPLALKEGQLPAGLAAGDRVLIVATAGQSSPTGTPTVGTPIPGTVTAVVEPRATDPSATLTVSVMIPKVALALLAGPASSGNVVLARQVGQ